MFKNLFTKKIVSLLSILCLSLLVGCSDTSSNYYDNDYDDEGYYNGEDYENDIGHPSDYEDEYIEEDYQKENFAYYDTPNSSCFAQIGYSSSSGTLYVYFRKGGEYYYYDVPSDLFNDFLHAESKGKFYNAYVKGQYECEPL